MVRKDDMDNRMVGLREDEQHLVPGVRKKFAKQSVPWAFVAICLTTFISLGWLPPVTSADMDRHEQRHNKDFIRVEKMITDHEALPKHAGAPSNEDFDARIGEIKAELNHLEAEQKAQGEKIHTIQVDTARIKSDVDHIKDGIGDIKALLKPGG